MHGKAQQDNSIAVSDIALQTNHGMCVIEVQSSLHSSVLVTITVQTSCQLLTLLVRMQTTTDEAV